MRSKRTSRKSSSSSSPSSSSSSSSSSSMAGNPTLSDATISDILSRLPVKSLARFESLSKPFSALIKSPDFISSHLRRTSRHPCVLIRRFQNSASHHSFIAFVDRQKQHVSHEIDIPSMGDLLCFPKIIGSCNGLVCLDISPCYATKFVLWNISTRQHRGIPNPQLTGSSSSRRYWMVATGFGPNRRSNDYKLVRIVNYTCKSDELPSLNAEVYSWRTGSWQVIADEIGSCVINERQRGVVVDGMLHWVAVGGGNFGTEKFVLSFDLDTEQFRRIKIPDVPGGVNVKVMGFKGSLALALYAAYPGSGRQVDRMELWGLDDCGGDGLSFVHVASVSVGCPVGALNETGMVVKRVDGNYATLLLYDPGMQYLSKLHLYDADYTCDVFSYVESLVPVDGGHEMVVEQDPE